MAADDLVESIPFDVQMTVWGYAITGSILEWSAQVAEARTPSEFHWDRTAEDLRWERVDRGKGPRPVPDRFALHWVTIQMMQEAS